MQPAQTVYFDNDSGLVCIWAVAPPPAGAACGMSCCFVCLFHELSGARPPALAALTLNATPPSQTGGPCYSTFMMSAHAHFKTTGRGVRGAECSQKYLWKGCGHSEIIYTLRCIANYFQEKFCRWKLYQSPLLSPF